MAVAVFEHGWLGGVLGVSPGRIEPWLPVFLFVVVFGLSLDCEVFLIFRVHGRWLHTGDPPVSRGRAWLDRRRDHRSRRDYDLRVRVVRVRLRTHL